MDITIGEEKIVELVSALSPEAIHDKALAKRVDAFGQIVKFMQRPKPEEIELGQTQMRFEPFWYGSARAYYKYERRHRYQVPVAEEVRSVTVYEHDHAVQSGHSFPLEAVEHCEEEHTREMMLDPITGDERDLAKYLTFPGKDAPNMQSLEEGGALVIVPEVRSSFLVGKLTQSLLKTIQADKIHDERIDIDKVVLYFRPIYAFEFLWKSRDKRSVLEFDALTGESRTEPGQMKKQIVRVLDNDDLFDIGSDAVGTFVPGANIAIKLGRLAARKALN